MSFSSMIYARMCVRLCIENAYCVFCVFNAAAAMGIVANIQKHEFVIKITQTNLYACNVINEILPWHTIYLLNGCWC